MKSIYKKHKSKSSQVWSLSHYQEVGLWSYHGRILDISAIYPRGMQYRCGIRYRYVSKTGVSVLLRPNQQSCQNWIWLPVHTSNRMHSKEWSSLILILFRYLQPWVSRTSFEHHAPHSSPYFIVTTHLHNPFSSNPNHHYHLSNECCMRVVSFRIPNLLLAKGVHTFSHPTKQCLNSSPKPP